MPPVGPATPVIEAEIGAAALADALRQGGGNFPADRSMLRDQFSRNLRELCLQFIGVDDGPSEICRLRRCI